MMCLEDDRLAWHFGEDNGGHKDIEDVRRGRKDRLIPRPREHVPVLRGFTVGKSDSAAMKIGGEAGVVPLPDLI